MNSKFNCKTCESADKKLESFIADLSMETSHHRMEGQSVKCGFGLQGICCRLCSNGPCRITPKGPKGVCGATADTIVARNFLRAVSAGSGCYIHIVENTARLLKKTAQTGGLLKGKQALTKLAGIFEIDESDEHILAEKIADMVLADLYKPDFEKMELVEKLAYKPRFDRWKELGILPVLNFGPCLAIGRLEMVATELAEAIGVDLPQLPLVLSAPQWLEEQALADGAFGLSLGLPLHLGLPPFVTGSPVAVQVFTQDMLSLTGGQLIIDDQAESAAATLNDIIEKKRKELNI